MVRPSTDAGCSPFRDTRLNSTRGDRTMCTAAALQRSRGAFRNFRAAFGLKKQAKIKESTHGRGQ